MNTNDGDTRFPGWGWTVALAAICLGLLIYCYRYAAGSVSGLAFGFGRNAVIGLALWGLFHLAVGRTRPGSGQYSVLAIACAILVGGVTGDFAHKEEARRMAGNLKKEYAAMTDALNDAQGMPQRIERKMDTTPTASGELGEIERFIKNLLNRMAALRNDYLAELDAIGWGRILDPERIKNDGSLEESKAIIRKGKAVVEKYRNLTHAAIDEARNDVAKLKLDDAARGQLLAGFEKGAANARTRIDAIWGLEADTVAEFENIFVLLEARRNAWAIRDGKIMFASAADLKQFNGYLARIDDLTKKQEALQKQGVDTANKGLSRLAE